MRVKSDGFSKSRDWRLEAVIPKEMYYVARRICGDDVITNPAKMHRGLEEGFGGVFEHNARMRVKSDGEIWGELCV